MIMKTNEEYRKTVKCKNFCCMQLRLTKVSWFLNTKKVYATSYLRTTKIITVTNASKVPPLLASAAKIKKKKKAAADDEDEVAV